MNKLFNTSITKNSPIVVNSHGIYPKLSQQQTDEILSYFFEQLLIFDEIVVSTDKDNFALFFLIQNLGIKTVERLVKNGYLKFEVSKSLIFSLEGKQGVSKAKFEKEVLGRPPLTAGSLSESDFNPENNVEKALKLFDFQRNYRRILIRDISKAYVNVNENQLASDTVQIIIDSYRNNLLEDFGLPFNKEENMLNLDERRTLFDISRKVLNASNMLGSNYKSMNSFDELQILKKGYENIEKAYQITESTTEILNIENVPDLKQLYLLKKYNIDDIFRLRHLRNAKLFREWINNFNQDIDCKEVTEAYISEATGSRSFFESNKGKIFKEVSIFGLATSASFLIGGPLGLVIGLPLSIIANKAFDSIVMGKNPKIYIDSLKKDIL